MKATKYLEPVLHKIQRSCGGSWSPDGHGSQAGYGHGQPGDRSHGLWCLTGGGPPTGQRERAHGGIVQETPPRELTVTYKITQRIPLGDHWEPHSTRRRSPGNSCSPQSCCWQEGRRGEYVPLHHTPGTATLAQRISPGSRSLRWSCLRLRTNMS